METVVDESKIKDYLLSDTHEIGKHKAKYFKAFNFDASLPSIFEKALKKHALDRDIHTENDSLYGVKYTLSCIIETPDERNPCIISVWIIENDSKKPKLITAYPAK